MSNNVDLEEERSAVSARPSPFLAAFCSSAVVQLAPAMSVWVLIWSTWKETLWSTLVLTAIALYFVSYVMTWGKKRWKGHRLYYVDTEFNRNVLSRCPRMTDYRLPFLLAHATVHSIWSGVLREHVVNLPPYRRVIVQLRCGESIAVDWAVQQVDRACPTLLLLHGITGHSMASYCKHMVKQGEKRGLQVALMNNRGCGGSRLERAVSFNAARTDDLHQVVEHIRGELNADTKLYIIGFSMGGTVLIKYLAAHRQGTSLVQGAVAVSTNFNLELCASVMERPYSFQKLVINRGFCARMQSWFRLHESVFENHRSDIDASEVYQARTLREFDRLVNIPTSEFATVEEYYSACSTHDKVGLVDTPLLCIQSEDDPVSIASGIPYDAFKTNPHIMLNVVSSGGHVGFLERSTLNTSSWIEDCCLDFIISVGAEPEAGPASPATNVTRTTA